MAAAQKVFGQHGVGGTSLQMIADEIGVTKAAVYHQYNTKEEIVQPWLKRRSIGSKPCSTWPKRRARSLASATLPSRA